jgi:hypothetical protein
MPDTRTFTRPASLSEWLAQEQARAPLYAESAQHGLAYQPQPGDVFIAPFAKCGTTWLQQIVHGLRTGGDTHAADLTHVIPWLEMAHYAGIDLHAPQPGSLRAFKSHLSWARIPKGGRYIVSFRDPQAALVAYYNFVNGYYWQTNSVSITEFAQAFYLNYQADSLPGSYWGHLVSWWEQRQQAQVLLLSYEGMKADLPAAVRTIAHFLRIEHDQALLDLVVKQTSVDFVLTRQAQVARETELPAPIGAAMDAIWREVVASRTGLASYRALQAALD